MSSAWSQDDLANAMKNNPDLAERNKMTLSPQAKFVNRLLSEADFQTRQIKDLQLLGFLVHAERPAYNKSGKYSTPIQGDKGFPDVVAIHPVTHVILIIENKSSEGKLSASQEKWIIAAAGCPGVKAMVARPEDWEEIIRKLSEGR